MWLVRLALTKPYTFVVFALLIILVSIVSIVRTPTDIFPSIKIPVVSVVWTYYGLSPEEMADRITFLFERQAPITVSDIAYMESQSFYGMSVIKMYFQPGVDLGLAMSEITAVGQSVLKYLPPGSLPPQVMSYNASSIPTLQLVLSSDSLSEQEVFDIGNNFVRTQVAAVGGTSVPLPYGGKWRQTRVDLNHQAMQTYMITPEDVNTALTNQNLIFPAGTQKIGEYEWYVKLNAQPIKMEDMNMLPVRNQDGAIYYMRDIGYVHDGYTPQTNIVRFNGKRAIMMPVQKISDASTLGIVSGVKELLPRIKAALPAALNIDIVNDQSVFIKTAIKNVMEEIIIAAALTGLLIILFLGSWHSTLIICISIPLSILSSVIIMSLMGETFNLMTLGGFALAVGILVDDATVTLESINMNLEEGKEVTQAIMDSANQIVLPLLTSMLCICIVFFPMFFLSGTSPYLFVPMGKAVVFSLISSYFLSRTLVVTLAQYWLKKHEHEKTITRFDKFRARYHDALKKVLGRRSLFVTIFLFFIISSLVILTPWLGSNFFPDVDGHSFNLHVRAPTGTRVEETARLVDEVDNYIRSIIPAKDIETIVDNIGLPVSGVNLTYSNAATLGPEDADILITLKEDHNSSRKYARFFRKELPKKFPGVTFSFLAADIVDQILNFGLPSPINIKIIGLKLNENFDYAVQMLDRLKYIPGIVDAHIQQAFNYPQINVDIDRSLALELGLTELDIAKSSIFAFSGSFQIAPTFWLNYDNSISYPLVVQTPQYRLTNMQQLLNIPLSNLTEDAQILGAVATIKRTGAQVVQSHYNSEPLIDIYANVQDRDLGGVSDDIHELINDMNETLPKGSYVLAEGQMETQRESFSGLYWGMAFAVVFVYLLIVVNFQSWLDPYIIITALPGAVTGMVWMLFLTGTTLSVPVLIGAIMCMGIATANSILLVSFARREMNNGQDAFTAALRAGTGRLRPVIMTALAMIVGMIPMALGLGEGTEQNAPLGRTIIGGLLVATFATLFFVPCIFTMIHGKKEHA